MPRRTRVSTGGVVYHALNRAVGRRTLFHKEADYAAFERILVEAQARDSLRIVSYCLMPNHWHVLLWPARDGQLSDWMRWVTVTHAQRYHAHYHSVGEGPIYQGRFKSFPVQRRDAYCRAAARYVERNPLRAKLVARAEQWRWSSLWHRCNDTGKAAEWRRWLTPPERWPVEYRDDWAAWVNAAVTPAEDEALQTSARRGRPYGGDAWVRQAAARMGLQSTLRPRGRPRKRPEAGDANARPKE